MKQGTTPSRVRIAQVVTVPQTFALLEGQTRYMVEHGCEVIGISSAGPFQSVFADREPVQLISVEMPRRITPLADATAIAKLVWTLRRIRPHIVHAHTPKGGLLGMIAAFIAGVPVRIYHMRGLPMMTAKGIRRLLLTSSERLSCLLAHRVLCVSHSLREYAVAQHLCRADKIVTLLGGTGNGIDSRGRFDPDVPVGDVAARRHALRTTLGIPPDAIVIGFLGRLVADKGVTQLAEAWSVLSRRFPTIHLLVAGPWEPQDPVPADIRDALETDARVHLLGQISDTRTVYAAADIVTLPTYREGMPNVPLEASSMRLPVVATRIPGCVDAVDDGTTGILVPARDSAALEAALATYVENKVLRERHGAAGRERVLREFDRERIWGATLALYQELLRRHVPQALEAPTPDSATAIAAAPAAGEHP